MGIRYTQIMGITEAAQDFLNENKKRTEVMNTCPHCGHEYPSGTFSFVEKIYASAEESGMFDDGPMLWEYTLRDGRVVREKIQNVIWSSGPCIFLQLVNEEEKVLFCWTDREMLDACG